jgi:superfamily II DNA or RNA helicase
MMLIVTINNSYSKISGLSVSQDKAVREELSYLVGGSSSFFSKYGPRRKSLLSKAGEFPTGVLEKVLYFFKASRLKYTLKDSRIRPAQILNSSFRSTIVPYEAQVEAVAAAVTYGRGSISMPTGSGKSLVIALIAHELRVKTLVVVPSLEIKRQLTESLQSVFTDTSWITVENIDSANLKVARGYNCLIIDEAHHVAAKTYQKLNKSAWSGVYYRFFLTATPYRNDPEEMLLYEAIAGQSIYNLTYDEAVKNKYIVPVDAYYIESPRQETDAYTYAQVYSELVVNNNIRNRLIADLMFNIPPAPMLCLVREVKHGEILSSMTGVPFVSGADESSRQYIEQFSSGVITSLIGTTGILGEGIDTKPCEYVIIAGLGKAKSQFMQQVGRGVRRYETKESAKIILIKDKSHKFLTRHFNAQSAILNKEYGVKPIKLEVK